MPNDKRNRKPRARRRPAPREVPLCAEWFFRDILPRLRVPNLRRSRSARHFRNAAIEVLEAMRALLDETIERLRREGRPAPELKRIRVEK